MFFHQVRFERVCSSWPVSVEIGIQLHHMADPLSSSNPRQRILSTTEAMDACRPDHRPNDDGERRKRDPTGSLAGALGMIAMVDFGDSGGGIRCNNRHARGLGLKWP